MRLHWKALLEAGGTSSHLHLAPVPGLHSFLQDVNDYWSMHFPELYEPGQRKRTFNHREFIKCMLYSVYSSLVLFFVPYGAIQGSEQNNGKSVGDYQSFALTAQTCLVVVVSFQVGTPFGSGVWGGPITRCVRKGHWGG